LIRFIRQRTNTYQRDKKEEEEEAVAATAAVEELGGETQKPEVTERKRIFSSLR
jgi:hypothetical protein